MKRIPNNIKLALLILNIILITSIESFTPHIIKSWNQRATPLKMTSDYTPLEKEGDWSAYLDEVETGFVYYFNGKTGESRWEPPTDTFPKIKLTKQKLKSIQEMQSEYLSRTSEREVVEKKGFSFGDVFNGFSAKGDTVVEEVAEEEVVEETASSGFNFFGNKKTQEVEETATTVETGIKQQKLPRSLFSFGKPSETPTRTDLTITASSQILPHPDKVSWGGEDAVLCLSRTYGIFDGVSGADKLDGVPLYSNTLGEILEESIEKEMEMEYGLNGVELKNLLTDAAEYADATASKL